MSDNRGAQEGGLDPVYVIESIPVAGEQQIPAQVIRSEGIPPLRISCCIPSSGEAASDASTRDRSQSAAPRGLKRIDKKLAAVPMYREGFIAEAQMTGQLEHPNIVPARALGRRKRRALLHDEAGARHRARQVAPRSVSLGRARPNASKRGSRSFSRSATRSPTRTTAA